jgi:magnesium-transporting ATPase (P-type)
LAFEPAEEAVMRRPPRPPGQALITRQLLMRIVYVSLLMVAMAFFVYERELARGHALETARTAVVNMLVFGELAYLFNVRHLQATALRSETLYGNPVAVWASTIMIVLQLLMTYAPPMQQMFHTAPLGWESWWPILVLAGSMFLAVEAEKWVRRRLAAQAEPGPRFSRETT